jgi:hypothetical protein
MSFAQALHRDVQARDATVEQRRANRNRVLLAAKFVYGPQRQFTPECTIWNLTNGGAAVRFPEDQPLPPVMELVETRSGRAHRAVVIWRRGGWVGLELSNSRDLRVAMPSDPVRRLWAINQLR